MGYGEKARQLRANLTRPLKRSLALLKWRRTSFDSVPIVFGNAMPKSGSHLLRQILEGICRLGPFVETGRIPVRTITIHGRLRSQEEILADLRRLRPGDVASGYLRATEENIRALSQPGWAVYFIIRDPRDMLVSHLYYATEMYPGHGMHEYYNRLPNMDERLKVAIRGIHEDGLDMAGVAERYARIAGFLDRPEIMTVRFEDLILYRDQTINAMLDRLETGGFRLPVTRPAALKIVRDAIEPSKSPTFRKGTTGDWRNHFTDEHKALFKAETGDLLIKMGYEKDHQW